MTVELDRRSVFVPASTHRQRLVAIARESAWLMQALRTVRALDPREWCIGAGAIRDVCGTRCRRALERVFHPAGCETQ